MLSTARDILFLWVARMIMMGLRFTGQAPFSDVYIHSVIQAPDGRRMSKSLGTGIDPLDEIDRHGADAVRFGLLAMSSSQDVRYSAEKVRQGQALANKLFNATRFALLRIAGLDLDPAHPVELEAIEPAPRPRTIEDRWILSRLQEIVADTAARIEDYDFSHAALGLYDFVYAELCDWYLEIVKPRLAEAGRHSPPTDSGDTRCARIPESTSIPVSASAAAAREDREALAATLLYVLRETVALAHPVIPFVTEELWSYLDHSGELLAGSRYPRADASLIDRDVEIELERVIEAVTLVRGWRDSVNAPPGALVRARIDATGYHSTAAILANLARLDFGDGAGASDGVPSVASISVPCGTVEVLSADGLDLDAAERRRAAARAKLEGEIARVEGKLANARLRAARAGGGGRGRARQAGSSARRTGGAVSGPGGGGPGGDTRGDGRGGGGRASAGPPTGNPSGGQPWSGERAERHLRSLELFGMRFGLDRMRRMMTVLGSPQRRFRSVHVVGTNGKTSTTRMIAAILERHGLRTGAYLSPHLISYAERVQVAERDLASSAFAAAVARAAWAAERVNRTLAEDDHVTQFELLTAAAFWVLAEREVEVAVVEAGLGGRYDATAVVESPVTVLTNVGLEHTRWLGPTVRDIATEKLAVVRTGGTLALGVDLHPEALAVAHAVAGEARARIVQVSPEELAAWPTTSAAATALASTGTPASSTVPAFQRRNFALARVAAEAYLADAGIAMREEAIREAVLATHVPGRMQIVADDPLTVLDGAHNPHAARALVESLPALLAGRRLALVMGVLEDKDAASMLAALLPSCARAWFTAPPSARALSPAALQSLARQQGFEQAACEPHPRRALEQAREWARAQSGETAVLATGSVYLVGDLLACLADGVSALGDAAPTDVARRRA